MARGKNWHVYDAPSPTTIEFHLEGFNITNTSPRVPDTRTTYNPSLTLAQQSFGQITTAKIGRVLQAALKVHWPPAVYRKIVVLHEARRGLSKAD